MPASIPTWRPAHARGVRPSKEIAHYRTSDWESRRLRILVRDAYVCSSCSIIVAGKAAHVDHVRPLEDGGTDADENLQTLCASCHGRKTRAEQRRTGNA